MASQYFIQRENQETGPFGFRELVTFVREGKLVDSDRVRFSWTNEWQRADSLVGLFRMAKRPVEVLTAPDPSPVSPPPPEPAAIELAAEADVPEVENRPGWVLRLMNVGGFRGKRPAEIPMLCQAPATASETSPLLAPQVGGNESASSPAPARGPDERVPAEIAAFFSRDADGPGDRWSSAVDEAMASVAAAHGGKSSKSRTSCFRKTFGGLSRIFPNGEDGQSLLRNGFRIVCAVICANLVAWAVENWSAQEALRFPSRETQQATLRHFPLLGTCGSGEYLFLVFDLMLVTGVAVWFAAGWIESHAE